MGIPRTLTTHAITTASVPAATETVVATLTGVDTQWPDTNIALDSWLAFTTGTLVTAVRLRLRRDSLTGTVVADSGAVTAGVAASSPSQFDISGDDSIPASANRTYVLTVTTTGAGTNGTVTAVELNATYNPS